MKNQFEGWYGHQFKAEEKDYNRLKSNAEDALGQLLLDGVVKIGSEEWRNRCHEIEFYDEMASRLNTKYNEND